MEDTEEKVSKAWQTYDWTEGQLMDKSPSHLIVVDDNGAQVAEFKVTGNNLRVAMEWDTKTGKALKWRDANDIYPKFPKWLRLALTARLSGATRR